MAMNMKTKTLLIKVITDLKKATKDLETLSDKADKTGKRIKKMGAAAKVAIGVGIGLLIKGLKDSVQATIRQENAIKQLNTVLASTRHAAGLTSEELQNMASGLQEVTTFGDEAIIEAQSMLLTFTKIGKDVFPAATEAVLNVSTAMGQDLRTSVVQLGKVLNDPIANMGALSRSGIQFTKDQKAMIKTLQESGRLMEAQTIILKELENQFGGSARAAAETFGGKLQQLKNAFGDFQEEVGKGITQNKDFNEALTDVKNLFKDPSFQKGVQELAAGIAKVVSVVVKLVGALPKLLGLLKDLKKTSDSVKRSEDDIQDSYNKRLKVLREFKKEIKDNSSEYLKFDRAFKRILKSQASFEDKTMAINKLLRAAKDGKFGQAIADDYSKFRKELLKLVKTTPAIKTSINKNIQEPVKDLGDKVKDIKDDVTGLKDELIDLPKSSQDIFKPIIDQGMPAKETLDKVSSSVEGLAKEQEIAGIASDHWARQLQNVADVANDMLSVWDTLGFVLEDIGIKIGDNIQNYVDSSMSALDKALSGDIVGAVMDAFKAEYKKWQEIAEKLGFDKDLPAAMGGGLLGKLLFPGKKDDKPKAREPLQIATEEFQKLIDAGLEGGKQFHEVLEMMEREGLKVAEITKYLKEQMESAADGYEKFLKAGISDVRFGALDEILSMRKKIEKNKELVEGAKGLAEVFKGLSNATKLSQDDFNDFQQAASDTFDKLKEAGFTNKQIMDIMGDSINRLAFLQKQFGLETDSTTDNLFKMAEGHGVLEDMVEPMDEVVDVLREIADILRNEFVGAAEAAAGGVRGAFGDMEASARNFGDAAANSMSGWGGNFRGSDETGYGGAGGNTFNSNSNINITQHGGNVGVDQIKQWQENNTGNINRGFRDLVRDVT